MAVLDNGNQLMRSHSTEWTSLNEPGVTGIDLKVLRYDATQRRAPTMLLRFAPGASYPAHDHPGGEEVFVLEGDIQIGDIDLNAGDYLYTAPGNSHPVRSDGGCVILVTIPEEVRKLDE